MTGRVVILACVILVGVGAWLIGLPTDRRDICDRTSLGTGPSGHAVRLCEILYEIQPSGETWVIVRAEDSQLDDVDLTVEMTDHDWACATWGLPALEHDPVPSRIVVQLMSEPFPRGEPSRRITQLIEAYSIQDGACIWEQF
ncbi:DUF6497 family protein [Gymnodinialimonas sp. 2305UL16-5]|uniref:DUF6497 family protein n=1 Tax=Gymnodinialimonas mytili TaxID=3126503 RepID=UPI0030B43779